MPTKIFKLVIVCVLICIAILLPGEIFQGYLDQYNNFYSTTFLLPKDQNVDKMLSDLQEEAEKNNIQIMKIRKESETTYSLTLDIYANEKAAEMLSEKYGLHDGMFKSIFSGSTKINIYDFNEIPKELIEEDTKYYLYGDFDDAYLFKQALADVYQGSFPKDDGYNAFDDDRNMVIAAWLAVIIVTIALDAYEIISKKKENFVLAVNGTRKSSIYFKSVLTDTFIMLIVYIAARLIVQKIEGNIIFSKYSDIMFVILLLINLLVFLSVFRVNYSYSKGNDGSERSIMNFSYILCCICSLLLIGCISSSVQLASTAYSYKSQGDFFENHSQYVWNTRLLYGKDEDDDDENRLDTLLTKFIIENPDDFFSINEYTEFGRRNTLFYLASSGTRDYLKDEIKELNDCAFDKDVYLLLPKSGHFNEEDVSELKEWVSGDSYEIIYYSSNVNLIYRIWGESSSPITEKVKNPVIMFNNHEYENISENGSLYEFSCGMVNNADNVWSNYAGEHGIKYSSTNVLDYYSYRWNALSRTVLINVVAVIVLAVIMITLLYVVIKLDFKVNAKKRILQKVYGYTKFERFKGIFIMIGSSGVICILLALILKIMQSLNVLQYNISLVYIIPAIILTMAILCIFTVLEITAFEKENLQDILKGGSI